MSSRAMTASVVNVGSRLAAHLAQGPSVATRLRWASTRVMPAALVLCPIPDQETALREIRRILVPDGQFRFLEHVRANTPGMVRAQRFMDATSVATPRPAVEHAGFTVERLVRSSPASRSSR